MANVNIKFNGKDFLLSCDDGQEEHLEELLTYINEKFNNLKNDLGNIGENKLLLITSVQIMDEYFETKKNVEQKKTELKNLSDKFKELKSLVYNYKDKKEEDDSSKFDISGVLPPFIHNFYDGIFKAGAATVLSACLVSSRPSAII